MKEFIHHTQIDQKIQARLTGYLLVEESEGKIKTEKIIEDGITRFFGGFGNRVSIFDLGTYKFALLMPEELPKMSCVSFFRNEQGDFAFMEGTFYDYDLLRRNKEKQISSDLAKEILKYASKEEYHKFKSFNGRYSGFVFVKSLNKLSVITDHYGANRVFVYDANQSFVVTNNVFALTKNESLKITINEASIAEIIHYEYPANRESEFNEINLVLPSDILIRHQKRNEVIKSYQKVNRVRNKPDKQYINELRESLDDFFIRTNEFLNEPYGIYLSKGKDSRLFLTFLEKHSLPYVPFVFREDTGIFDYPDVKKVAELLDKDLHVLDSHSIEKNFAFLTSMNPTFTTPWLALGKVAANYVSNALMGLYGESSSGKLCAYRNFGIDTLEKSIKATILGNSRGISREEAVKWVPYYKKWDTEASFRRIYENIPKVDLAFDYDTFQDIDHRSFRNAIVILTRAQHFVTPISPYMDSRVAEVYHSLPHSLLKSQLAHTIIAAEEKKSNKVKTTAFPVPLKYEKCFRNAIMNVVKFNNKYKDFLMSYHKKKYNPYIDKSNFVPQSEYFLGVFGGQAPVNIGNKRILTRMYNIDDYLKMTFELNIDYYFKQPVIIKNELSKEVTQTNS